MRLLLIFPLLFCFTRGDPVAEADAEAEADAVADADAEADPIAQILYGQAGGPGSYYGSNQMNPGQGSSIEPMIAMNQMNLPTGNNPMPNYGDVYNNFETSGNSLQPPLMNNPMASQQPEAPIMSNPTEGNMEVNGQGQMFTRSYTPISRPGQRCYNMCRYRPNYWPNTSCRPVCNVRPACNTRRPWIDYRVRGRTVFCRPRQYPNYSCGSSGCGGSGYYPGSSGGSGYNQGSSGGSGYPTQYYLGSNSASGGSSGGGGYPTQYYLGSNSASGGDSGYYPGGGSGYNPGGCQSSGSCGGIGGSGGSGCGGGGSGCGGGGYTQYYLGSNSAGAQEVNYESSNSGSLQPSTANEIQVTEVN